MFLTSSFYIFQNYIARAKHPTIKDLCRKDSPVRSLHSYVPKLANRLVASFWQLLISDFSSLLLEPTLLQCSWTLFLWLLEPQNVLATLPDAVRAAECSCNALAMLLDAVPAAAGATERSCNAPGRCFCCCCSHKTLPQRSQTMFLLLLEPQNAPTTL